MKIAGHEFEGPFPDQSEISDRRGIYVVLCLVDREPHCVLDVGESGKLRKRLETNDRKRCWREKSHGELGFCVKYTSHKGGVNPREHAPPGALKKSDQYERKERHVLEEELQWKLEYPCSENRWKKIEVWREQYQSYEERFGPRGSYRVDDLEDGELKGLYRTPNEISKKARGVYVVTCLVDGDPHCVLDIGASSQIGDRLRSHDRQDCWERTKHGGLGYYVRRINGSSPGLVPPSKDYTIRDPPNEMIEFEHELKWKLKHSCGKNPWVEIEQDWEEYSKFEQKFGPRGSYDVQIG